MGLFDKLKEATKGNTLFQMVKKELIADGEVHILNKSVSVIISDKTINQFPEFMKEQGFEVLDIDVIPEAIKNLKHIKVKYRSTK